MRAVVTQPPLAGPMKPGLSKRQRWMGASGNGGYAHVIELLFIIVD